MNAYHNNVEDYEYNANRWCIESVWQTKNMSNQAKFGVTHRLRLDLRKFDGKKKNWNCVWFRENQKEKKHGWKLGGKIIRNKW